MKTLLIVGALVVALIAIVVATYNPLVGLREGVNAQWAQVENVYQRRADLIPNLVKTVQGAANFEKSTLEDVVKARASATQVKIDPSNPEQFAQFQKAQGELSGALSRLLVTVEKYPELKATEGFRDLQAQLEGTENRITVERGKFNEVVRTYNTKVQTFPTVLVARVMGFAARPYFDAKPGSDTPPVVDFGNAK
jgi:LemA protein